ncbi:MAG: hypothetical protein LBS55_07725 [Prevotellaceae bacterium]|jgi:hypothetical protein|nr:hypothetical protein [Prevotellaceae bacterium]
MKKVFFILAFLVLAIHTHVSAQVAPLIHGSKSVTPIKGGSEGKTYAVIIRTDLSKQALVDSATLFLAHYGLVDRNNVHLDEINEETSEYTVSITIPQTITTAKMMGMSIIVQPVMVDADLRFEFHDNGSVMIVFQNLKNYIFQFVEKAEQCLTTKFGKLEQDPSYKEYGGEQSAVLTTNTLIGKALIGLNTGLEGYSAFMKKVDEYFVDIGSKYKVYGELVKKGFAEWLTDKELIQYADNTDFAGKKNTVEGYRKAYDEGKMLGVGQGRWEKQIRECCDLLFKTIAAELSGTIEGVAEDGEQTWINIDGAVVPVDPKWKDKTPPTDPKAREKYLKKHKDKQY